MAYMLQALGQIKDANEQVLFITIAKVATTFCRNFRPVRIVLKPPRKLHEVSAIFVYASFLSARRGRR